MKKGALLFLSLFFLVGCIAINNQHRTSHSSLPNPDDSNYWSTNAWTPPPWTPLFIDTNVLFVSPTVGYSLRATGSGHNPGSVQDVTTTIAPLDSNHMYSVERMPTLAGPWSWTLWTNVVTPSNSATVTDTLPMQHTSYFYRALVWTNRFVLWADYEGGQYVNYTKSVADGWGWTPNGTNIIVRDIVNPANIVLALGNLYDAPSGTGTVVVPYPTFSPVYRFTIFFNTTQPAHGLYPIVLEGFNP